MSYRKAIVRAAMAAAVTAGCVGGNTPITIDPIVLTSDLSGIKTDGTAAHVAVTVTGSDGKPGTGSIAVSTTVGDVNGQGLNATLSLSAQGTANVTYSCNSATSVKCSQNTAAVLSVTWNTSTRALPIALSASSSTGSSSGSDAGTGTADAGTGGGGGSGVAAVPTSIAVALLNPTYLIVSTAANAAQNLPGTTQAGAVVLDQTGAPMVGQTVNFAEVAGESLVSLSAATAVTDATGTATITVTSKAQTGTAHVNATVGTVKAPAVFTIPVIGGPSVVAYQSATPAVLGRAGSGIQENGTMTFKVQDAFGTAVPNVTVSLAQAAPALVTFAVPSVISAADGTVVAAYTSSTEIGVTTIKATATGGSTPTGSAPMAVRAAKPSGSGLYFRCSQANLPAYQATNGFASTTCRVALTDRYGDRVGIATPVYFGAEAGAISAVATTKGFDYANPSSTDEGTVTVTYSTDLGNGYLPLDVDPLLADATSQPGYVRNNPEPSYAVNGVTYNPRDQLVTLIAMVRGEEAFVDANHNGSYDPGETFVDLGDPFIDANDNGTYETAVEQRFCNVGSCAAFQGPNGIWDADRIIWTPTWVVLSGQPSTMGNATTVAFNGGITCDDYLDNTLGNTSDMGGVLVARDRWLNTLAAGTTFGVATSGSPTSLTLTQHSSGQLDSWGAAGMLHQNFDYVRVSAADNTKPCVSGACVMRLVFGDFDPGTSLTFDVQNGNKLPGGATGGACPNPSAGTTRAPFGLDFTITTVTAPFTLSRTVAYGK